MRLRLFARRSCAARRSLCTAGPANKPGAKGSGAGGAAGAAEAASLIPPRYLAVIIPLLSFGVLSTAVINNRALKEAVEAVAPAYINFLRQHYGFEEEDIDEERRVQLTILSNNQAVDVTVSCSDGRQLLLEKVPGSCFIPELLDLVSARLGSSESANSSRSRDDNDQQPVQISLSFNDSSDPANKDLFQREKSSVETVFGSKYREPVSGEADLVFLQTPSLEQPYIQNEWLSAVAPPSGSQIRAQRKECLRLGEKGRPPDRSVLIVTHHNTVAALMTPLLSYYSTASIFGSVSRSALASIKAAQKFRPNPRTLATEKIAVLEGRVSQLYQELNSQASTGGLRITREIDTIHNEIRALKAQITQLRREHLNYFYFF